MALLRLRERVVRDPYGALTSWRSCDTENNPCSWFGVECSDGKVVNLYVKTQKVLAFCSLSATKKSNQVKF